MESSEHASKGLEEGVLLTNDNFNGSKDLKHDDDGGLKKNSGDEIERESWGAKMDYMLSMIGYCVGLGNVWRFPYLCYANGGGAFLIPYLLMLTLAGIPLFYMESAMGQYASLGSISVWKALPIIKGVGYAMVTISTLVAIYYNMIIAWSLYFLFASFSSVLPWHHCGHWWNTPECMESSAVANRTNTTANFSRISPSEEYFHNRVLKYTDSIDDTGAISWELALCLLLSWIIVFFCLIKGVKSSGKVVYFTATFPYVVLIILLIRGLLLPGARDGIIYYIKPDFTKLLTSQIWYDGASQVFYSLGVAWGGILTMASYNKFNNNCYRDAIIVPLCNSGTSIFAGFVIFSYIGYMAHELKVDVGKVVAKGPGLAFIAYPEALTLMPISPLWAFLFFFMLLTLGLDSEFVTIETVITALSDEYPALLRRYKVAVLLVACIVMFLLGLPFCTQAGIYWVTLMDTYSAGFTLLIASFIMAIGISYVYGVRRLSANIKEMVGFEPNWYFKACWMVISPLMVLFIFIVSLVEYQPPTYDGNTYPAWAAGLGLAMAFTSIIMIPLFGILAVFRQEGTLIEKVRAACRPEPDWGPAHVRAQLDEKEAINQSQKLAVDRIPLQNP
ncbi:SLC6A5 [Branchiostoma lanceolatum]|uniref:Transporter n=1 Tax=Branchiostoma lanceolatum TaxID=7740 RepID=A0A8K0EVW8_BRALA|nr:SLC6A5 [Branchiostoma lanceolatum]